MFGEVATTTGGSSYTPQDTYTSGVGGVWYKTKSGDSGDLKAATNGAGAAAAELGVIGSWAERRSGGTSYLTEATASLRPVMRDGKCSFFHATNTTDRIARFGNAAIAAIPRANCSGGFIVDIFDNTSPAPILDLGGSDLAFMLGTSSNYNKLSYFDAVAFRLGTYFPRGRKCVVTWRSNATNLTINVDGQEATYTALSAVAMTKIKLSCFNGGSPCPHGGIEYVVFNQDVGATEIAKLRTYLNAEAGTASINAAKVVIEVGDSIDGSVGSEIGKPPSDYVTNRSDSVWYRYNKEGGFLSTGLVPISTTEIISIKGATETVVLYCGGTNDILSGLRTGAALYTHLTSQTATLRASGVKVLWVTLGDFVTNRAEKDAYNALLIANYATLADGIVRRDSVLPDCTNATLFTSDQVHPKDAGHALYGAEKQTAMAALP